MFTRAIAGGKCSHAERSNLTSPAPAPAVRPLQCYLIDVSHPVLRGILHATKVGGANYLKMEALLNVWYERFEAVKASIDHSIENGGE